MTSDAGGLAEVTEDPFEEATFLVPALGRYNRSSTSFSRVEGDCCVQMGNWELSSLGQEELSSLSARKASRMSSF